MPVHRRSETLATSPYRKLICTPGVRHLAERAGAYWLIDAIASWLPSRHFREAAQHGTRIADIYFWKLTVGKIIPPL